MTDERCSAMVQADWHAYPCRKRAKVVTEAGAFCGMHDPAKIAERRAAKMAKWEADWQRRAERDAREARIPVAARGLAMMALQSARYESDAAYRVAVDEVLALTEGSAEK